MPSDVILGEAQLEPRRLAPEVLELVALPRLLGEHVQHRSRGSRARSSRPPPPPRCRRAAAPARSSAAASPRRRSPWPGARCAPCRSPGSRCRRRGSRMSRTTISVAPFESASSASRRASASESNSLTVDALLLDEARHRLRHQVAQRPPRGGPLADRRGGDAELRHLQHRRPPLGAEAAHHRGDVGVGDPGPSRDREPRQLGHPLRLAPTLEADGGVRPHHEHQLRVALFATQAVPRSHTCRTAPRARPRGSRPQKRESSAAASRVIASRCSRPGSSAIRLCGASPVGTSIDLAQLELPERLLGERQVAEVRRVERRAEDADAAAGRATHAPGRRRGRRTCRWSARAGRSARGRAASGSSCRSRRPSRTRSRR